jgi:GTPase SAR1 family protein
MSSQQALKIAFIGSHGVGKTTLCYGLAARLKERDVSLDVVGEVARRCPLPINRGTTREAQTWILHTQIAEELLASARYELVISDRSVLDNFVYLLLATGHPNVLEPLVDMWARTYDLLVHVPILDQPNPDGIRSTDPSFQLEIERRLAEEIAKRDLSTVLRLHEIARPDWLDVVENHVWDILRPGQLELPMLADEPPTR